MRPLKMTDAAMQLYLEQVKHQALKLLTDYHMEAKMSMNMNLDMSPREKVVITFSPSAYLKCWELVRQFPGEVGWFALINRIDETHFRVYDVLVPEQKVSGVRVIDNTVDTVWYDSLSDDQLNHMYLHIHSHVNMSTTDSDIDKAFQKNLIDHMSNEGYYIFQIWNKQGDINTFLYDLDNNAFYGKDDVVIQVEDDTCGTLQNFMEKARESVTKIEFEKSNFSSPVKFPIKEYNIQREDYDLIRDETRMYETIPGFSWDYDIMEGNNGPVKVL